MVPKGQLMHLSNNGQAQKILQQAPIHLQKWAEKLKIQSDYGVYDERDFSYDDEYYGNMGEDSTEEIFEGKISRSNSTYVLNFC